MVSIIIFILHTLIMRIKAIFIVAKANGREPKDVIMSELVNLQYVKLIGAMIRSFTQLLLPTRRSKLGC